MIQWKRYTEEFANVTKRIQVKIYEYDKGAIRYCVKAKVLAVF